MLDLPKELKKNLLSIMFGNLKENNGLVNYFIKIGFEKSYKKFIDNKSYGLYPSGAIAFLSKYKIVQE